MHFFFHFSLCHYFPALDQSKLPKSLLIGGQCVWTETNILKLFDFNDFSLKLTKYLMLPDRNFYVKI